MRKKRLSARDLGLLFKETYKEWNEDRVPRLGAALAYYTVFSMAPMLIIAIVIAGAVFGRSSAEDRIIAQISTVVGADAGSAVRTMVDSTYLPPDAGPATITVGVLTLLLGALGVFGQLQDAFDTIWGVTPKPRAGYLRFLQTRLVSFTMVLVVGFLLLVSLVVSTALAAVGTYLQDRVSDYWLVSVLGNLVLPFLVTALLFGIMFKVLPDVRLTWRDVLPGALLTSLLFTLGKYAIGFYLGHSRISTAYGAAGSILIILVWIYFSAQILFFGAEFTQVWVRQLGQGWAPPTENAVPLTAAARASQGIPREAETDAIASAVESGAGPR